MRHAARSRVDPTSVKLEARSDPRFGAFGIVREEVELAEQQERLGLERIAQLASQSSDSKAARDRIWSPARKATHPRLNTASVTSNATELTALGDGLLQVCERTRVISLRRANFAENRERGRGCPWVTQRSGPRDCVLTENSRARLVPAERHERELGESEDDLSLTATFAEKRQGLLEEAVAASQSLCAAAWRAAVHRHRPGHRPGLRLTDERPETSLESQRRASVTWPRARQKRLRAEIMRSASSTRSEASSQSSEARMLSNSTSSRASQLACSTPESSSSASRASSKNASHAVV